jgi:hypothetical protein
MIPTVSALHGGTRRCKVRLRLRSRHRRLGLWLLFCVGRGVRGITLILLSQGTRGWSILSLLPPFEGLSSSPTLVEEERNEPDDGHDSEELLFDGRCFRNPQTFGRVSDLSAKISICVQAINHTADGWVNA